MQERLALPGFFRFFFFGRASAASAGGGGGGVASAAATLRWFMRDAVGQLSLQ